MIFPWDMSQTALKLLQITAATNILCLQFTIKRYVKKGVTEKWCKEFENRICMSSYQLFES